MTSASLTFGLYQLENLHRQQAKFMMVALTKVGAEIPVHRLLRVDLVADVGSASAKIQQKMQNESYPPWWPVVLISKDGVGDTLVAEALAKAGFINVYSYVRGWDSLLEEAP